MIVAGRWSAVLVTSLALTCCGKSDPAQSDAVGSSPVRSAPTSRSTDSAPTSPSTALPSAGPGHASQAPNGTPTESGTGVWTPGVPQTPTATTRTVPTWTGRPSSPAGPGPTPSKPTRTPRVAKVTWVPFGPAAADSPPPMEWFGRTHRRFSRPVPSDCGAASSSPASRATRWGGCCRSTEVSGRRA